MGRTASFNAYIYRFPHCTTGPVQVVGHVWNWQLSTINGSQPPQTVRSRSNIALGWNVLCASHSRTLLLLHLDTFDYYTHPAFPLTAGRQSILLSLTKDGKQHHSVAYMSPAPRSEVSTDTCHASNTEQSKPSSPSSSSSLPSFSSTPSYPWSSSLLSWDGYTISRWYIV